MLLPTMCQLWAVSSWMYVLVDFGGRGVAFHWILEAEAEKLFSERQQHFPTALWQWLNQPRWKHFYKILWYLVSTLWKKLIHLCRKHFDTFILWEHLSTTLVRVLSHKPDKYFYNTMVLYFKVLSKARQNFFTAPWKCRRKKADVGDSERVTGVKLLGCDDREARGNLTRWTSVTSS